MSSRGYIKLHRSLFKHEFFRPSKFSEREAFTWMIAEAAWKTRHRRVGQFFVDMERGELVASLRHLAEVWGWEVGAVRGYLSRCEKVEMLSTRSDKGITIVTVCNYDVYQGEDGDDDKGNDKVSAQGQQGLSTGAAHGQHNTEEGKKVRREEGEEQIDAPGLPAELGTNQPSDLLKGIEEPSRALEPTKRKRRARAPSEPQTLLDPNWLLSDADRQYARDRGWTEREINFQFEKFQNHHIGKGNRWARWDLAWRTWVGNGYGPRGPTGGGGAPVRSRADSTAEGILAGMDAHERFDP